MLEDQDSHKRFLMALTLSMALALAFSYLTRPEQTGKKKSENTAQKENTEGKQSSSKKSPSSRETPSNGPGDQNSQPPAKTSGPADENDEPSDKEKSEEKEKGEGMETPQNISVEETTLENKQIRAVFSNRGATLKRLIMKQYTRTAEKKEKVNLINDRFSSPPSFDIRPNTDKEEKQTSLGLGNKTWKIIESPEDPNKITYHYRSPGGLVIEKTFSLPEEEPFMMDVSFTISAAKDGVEAGQLRLYSPAGIVLQSRQDKGYHQGIRGYQEDGEWTYEDGYTADEVSEEEQEAFDIHGPVWTGVVNKYFGAIFIPRSSGGELIGYNFEKVPDESVETSEEDSTGPDSKNGEGFLVQKSVISYFVTESLSLNKNDSNTFQFQLYTGPKKESILKKYSKFGLPLLVDFGWFGVISHLFLGILSFFYGIIGNYGVAILLLTLIVKLCLHPLTKKAQISMHKMKELQPKIEALREKYGEDRQKMGEEQMKLFKEHGVNPLGGCLPMIFQMPVLIGLYYGIRISFEVRQKPFVSWINDLSQPDHFMQIGLGSFFGINFEFLNLLIVLMMATWLLSSFTQPTPSEGQGATQAKMMKFMPMIFGVIFYNFPSGLVLYWMTSTLFSAIEQLYIRKVVLKSD